MADENLIEVGIGFKVLHPDEFRAQLRKGAEDIGQLFGQSLNSIVGGQTTKAFEAESKKRVKTQEQETKTFSKLASDLVKVQRASIAQVTESFTSALKKQASEHERTNRKIDESNKQRLTGFRTVSDLEVQYAKAKTSEIIREASRLLTEKKKFHQDALMAETKAASDSAKVREKQLAEELKGLYDLARKREEVMRGGAGAMIQMLGVGRGVLGSVSDAAFQAQRGYGGHAMLASPGMSFGQVAGMVGAVGGAAAGVAILRDYAKVGMEVVRIDQMMEGAVRQLGLGQQQANAEFERGIKFSEEIGGRWNIDDEEAKRLTAFVLQMGRVHGEANAQIVKASLAVQEITKDFGEGAITAEQFAKIFNVSDPDREVFLGRLKLKYRDLADELVKAKDTGEALAIANKYLAPTYIELDRRAGSNEQSTRRAALAYKEIRDEIGVKLVRAGTLGFEVLSTLSGGVLANKEVIAGLTIVTGFGTAATVGYIIAKKALHDETIREIITTGQARVAQLLHAEATTTATGTTYAWGAALKTTGATASLYLLPLAAITAAYAIVKQKQEEILEKTKGLREEIEKQPPAVRQAAYDAMAWGGSMGEAKAKALLASQGTKYLRGEVDALGRAIVVTDQEMKDFLQGFDNLRTEAEGNLSRLIRNRLIEVHGWTDAAGVHRQLTDEQLADYRRADAGLMRSIKWRASNLNEFNALRSKYAKESGLEEGEKEAKAPEGVDYAKTRQQGYEDLLKSRAKSEKDTYDEILKMHEIAAQREVNMMEEQGLDERTMRQRSYNIKRYFLDLELEETKDVYGKQSNEYLALQLKIEDLDHQSNVQSLAEKKKQTTDLLTLTRQIEDARVSAIGNRIAKESKQEELRHARKVEDIKRDITDERARNATLELERLTHEQALAKISQDAYEDAAKAGKEYVSDVLRPISGYLQSQIRDYTKLGSAGSVAMEIIGATASRFLGSLEDKAATGLSNAIWKPKKEEGATDTSGGDSGASNIAGFLASIGVKMFGDSNGPVGQSGTPIVDGRALVLANPNDWLIDPSLQDGGGGTIFKSANVFTAPKAPIRTDTDATHVKPNSTTEYLTKEELEMRDSRRQAAQATKLLWDKRRESAIRRGENPDVDRSIPDANSGIDNLAGMGRGLVAGVAGIPLALANPALSLANLPLSLAKSATDGEVGRAGIGGAFAGWSESVEGLKESVHHLHEGLTDWAKVGQKPEGFRANEFMSFAGPMMLPFAGEAAINAGMHGLHQGVQAYEGIHQSAHIAEGYEYAKNIVFGGGHEEGQKPEGESQEEAHREVATTAKETSDSLKDLTKGAQLGSAALSAFGKNGLTGDKGVHKAAGAASSILGSISGIANILFPGSGAILGALSSVGGLFAEGTEYVPKSGRYIVGEERPEVVELPQGAKIHSNADRYLSRSQARSAPSYDAIASPSMQRGGGSLSGMSGPVELHPDTINALAQVMSKIQVTTSYRSVHEAGIHGENEVLVY